MHRTLALAVPKIQGESQNLEVCTVFVRAPTPVYA